MAGVWYFKDGVARNVPNPFNDAGHRKILVHCPSNEIITSFEQLDEKLLSLGWHPYNNGQRDDERRRQYHLCACSPDLLTLPATFNGMCTMHMYDIVVKTRSTFQVRDAL
jgi:hypothetical protein